MDTKTAHTIAIEEARELLLRLSQQIDAMDDEADTADIRWDDVGSLNHFNALLRDAADFIERD